MNAPGRRKTTASARPTRCLARLWPRQGITSRFFTRALNARVTRSIIGREHYEKKSIRFIVLNDADEVPVKGPDWLANPYRIYRWLKDKTFDVIHYPDYPGNGYFIALAKHQGLAFTGSLLCFGAHGPSMWSREANGYRIDAVRHLATDFLERQSAALSDVLISPSQAMAQWLRRQEWQLPEHTYVQQNILSPHALASRKPEKERRFEEIVFFGRIEPRKGYREFCDAIDLLPPDLMRGISVTFLGASTKLYEGDSADEVRQRAAAWNCPARILADKSHEEAIDYLRAAPCLAVIPSRDEVLGYTVMECIGAGIPFLAAGTGGIPELIAAEDRARVCFYPVRADVIAERIRQALLHGHKPAPPAIAFEDNRQRWVEWHNRLEIPAVAKPKSATPLVSLILVYPEQAGLAAETRASAAAQDYPHVEIIHAPVTENKAAALNAAAGRARGAYLQIVENGDSVVPHQVSICVRVAECTGASILTACFESTEALHVFLGSAPAVGAFMNIFGTGNVFMRREVFLALAGYDESAPVEEIYHRFYAKAVREGHRLEVIPEILFRRAETCVSAAEPVYDAAKLKPYFSLLSAQLRRLIFPSGNSSS